MGAVDFLEKPVDLLKLQESIQNAFRLDARLRAEQRSFHQLESRMAKLTARERETLELIVGGYSNKAMADQLFISERAVEMRRAGMLRKLGVKSTNDLLNLAITHRVLRDLKGSSEGADRR